MAGDVGRHNESASMIAGGFGECGEERLIGVGGLWHGWSLRLPTWQKVLGQKNVPILEIGTFYGA